MYSKMPAVPAFKYFWFVNPKHAMTRHPPRLTVITDLTIVQPSKEISNERIAFGICKDLQADTA